MKKLYYIVLVAISMTLFSCGVQSIATQQGYDDLYITSEQDVSARNARQNGQALTKGNAQDLDTIDLVNPSPDLASFKDTAEGYFYLDDESYDARMRLLYGGYYPDYNFYYYDLDPWYWDPYWYSPYRVSIYYGYPYGFYGSYARGYINGYWNGYWDGYYLARYWDANWYGSWGYVYWDPWYYSRRYGINYYYTPSYYYGTYYTAYNDYNGRERTYGHRVSSSVTSSSTPRPRDRYDATVKRDREVNATRMTSTNTRSQTRSYLPRSTQTGTRQASYRTRSDYRGGNTQVRRTNTNGNRSRGNTNSHTRTRRDNSYFKDRDGNYTPRRDMSYRTLGRTYRSPYTVRGTETHARSANEYRSYTRPDYNRSNSYSRPSYNRSRSSTSNFRSGSYSRGSSYSSGRSSGFSTGSRSSSSSSSSSSSHSSGRRR